MNKWITIAVILLCACNTGNKKDAENSVMNADKKFSDLSQAKGMKHAFLEYIDSNAVLLRKNHYPIVGKDAKAFLEKENDSAYTLTWEPMSAKVSASEDMAYSYGTYTLKLKDTTLRGSYISVWKKQASGDWKFVVDSGNEGLGK